MTAWHNGTVIYQEAPIGISTWVPRLGYRAQKQWSSRPSSTIYLLPAVTKRCHIKSRYRWSGDEQLRKGVLDHLITISILLLLGPSQEREWTREYCGSPDRQLQLCVILLKNMTERVTSLTAKYLVIDNPIIVRCSYSLIVILPHWGQLGVPYSCVGNLQPVESLGGIMPSNWQLSNTWLGLSSILST